jgi:hypothetical protein
MIANQQGSQPDDDASFGACQSEVRNREQPINRLLSGWWRRPPLRTPERIDNFQSGKLLVKFIHRETAFLKMKNDE